MIHILEWCGVIVVVALTALIVYTVVTQIRDTMKQKPR